MLKVEGTLTIIELPPRPAPADPEELRWLLDRGAARVVCSTKNKIVDLGLSAISRLIGFGLALPDVDNGVNSYAVADVNDLRITTMSFGNASNPTAPAALDNALFDGTPLTSVTPSASYPGLATVRWQGVIPAVGFTGQQITEEALFLANGAMFARTTFATQVMLPAMAKQFNHDFTISEV